MAEPLFHWTAPTPERVSTYVSIFTSSAVCVFTFVLLRVTRKQADIADRQLALAESQAATARGQLRTEATRAIREALPNLEMAYHKLEEAALVAPDPMDYNRIGALLATAAERVEDAWALLVRLKGEAATDIESARTNLGIAQILVSVHSQTAGVREAHRLLDRKTETQDARDRVGYAIVYLCRDAGLQLSAGIPAALPE